VLARPAAAPPAAPIQARARTPGAVLARPDAAPPAAPIQARARMPGAVLARPAAAPSRPSWRRPANGLDFAAWGWQNVRARPR
jgi:hypothetical protein